MAQTRMLNRSIAAGLVAAALAIGTVGALPAAASGNNGSGFQVPITGTTSNGGTFEGTATISGFAVDGQNVVALGTISGVVNGAQSFVSTFSTSMAMPNTTATATPQVAQATTACQPLNLMVGPLNLNIIGVAVSIPHPIVLNITGMPGSNNLVGNLVCSVVNLLNSGGAAQQAADQLNQIVEAVSPR
jgi:hypothetical protein